MKITVVAVGKKMPAWVYHCCDDYAQRMRAEVQLQWREVAMERRPKSGAVEQARRLESTRLLEQVQENDAVVALCERGDLQDTAQFGKTFTHWRESGRPTTILIGGPDGIDFGVAHPSGRRWPDRSLSLSPLTFPHPLVRVILAEQLYRAWSVSVGHPYHRV
ncbi:MAG: 23S rRNA (pseudouridine(1915)-N(3))-methyltransferase RlmH [Pseudomonadales bacterium]